MNWYHYIFYLGIYTLGYVFLVFATLADGHGIFLFASTLICWILFATAVMLIPLSRSKLIFLTIVTCVVAYYLTSCVIVIIEQTGEGNFERTVSFLQQHPVLFISTVIWYVIGQIVFWFLLIERMRRRIAP
jgi:hypothetical protein